MSALRVARSLLVSVSLFALACSKGTPTPADHRAADEATIRGLDSGWAKAFSEKNQQLALSYYADGASLFAPGAPLATGKDAIQKTWAGIFAMPGFALTFSPTTIDVSGDRAVDIGTYELTVNDKAGKPQTTKAKYIVVWGRQADGSWKALVDAATATL